MTRSRKLVVTTVALVFACSLGLRGSLPQVPTGAWQPGTDLGEARSGAAAVTLADGRVLMFGGTTPSGGATNAVRVFNPASNSWSDLGSVMLDARSGHSATPLEDGRVLLAGGENSSGPLSSLEIYDPITGSFQAAGTLSGPRKNHGAARLPDGRVLLIGGSTGSVALASLEIFDPLDSLASAGPALPEPRNGLSATALLDGRILIAGGNNGESDLASSEIYDPAVGGFTPGAALSTPRRGHTALRLPHNNSVLIAGGASAGADLPTAELYIPWSGSMVATGSLAAPRSGAAASALLQDGVALVAGGSGQSSTELYGFPTVKTDKGDYAPGETVIISGSGWQPGETVTMVLHELADFHGDRILTAVADGIGNIFDNEYSPEEHDIGVRYYLTASGSISQAQTTFTDGVLFSNVGFTIGPPTVTPSFSLTWSASATCRPSGASNCVNEGYTPGGPVQDGYSLIIEQATDSDFTTGLTTLATVTTSDGAAGSATGGGFPLAPLASGTYFYRARHPRQDLGDIPAVGAGFNFWEEATSVPVLVVVVDNLPPLTLITGSTLPAGGFTTSTSASFTLSGFDNTPPPPDLTFECSLDAGAFSSCTSPHAYAGLSDGPHIFQVRAIDAAGNIDPTPASRSWTVETVDTSAPEITPNVIGTAGANGWYTGDVAVSWTVTDPESAITSQSDACTTTTTLTTETTGQAVTCTATSVGGTATGEVTIKRDTDAPGILITTPADGASFLLNATLPADYACTDYLSGVVSCSGPIASGVNLDTATVGAKNFTVNATDSAGNPAAAVHSYSVAYNFAGFLQPIDNLPVMNTVKAGRTIPVKWQLKNAQSAFVRELSSFQSLTSSPIACDASAPSDTIEEVVAAGSTVLRYDLASEQFIYNWSTSSGWRGCRLLILTTADGVQHMAKFNF